MTDFDNFLAMLEGSPSLLENRDDGQMDSHEYRVIRNEFGGNSIFLSYGNHGTVGAVAEFVFDSNGYFISHKIVY